MQVFSSSFITVSTYRISGCIEVGQQLTIDEILWVIDHQVHDNLRNQIPTGLGHNLHVGVHEVPDGLHLPLQLRINRS